MAEQIQSDQFFAGLTNQQTNKVLHSFTSLYSALD